MFSKKDKEVVKEVTVVKLEKDQLKELEKMVARININQHTTQLEVSFQLGVQHVLQKLREGWVYERD